MARKRSRAPAGAGAAVRRSFYDCPQWYDIVHARGTAAEVNRLEHINRQFGNGGRRWLEPACGTGRYLRILAARGYRVTGYDASEIMLDYARRRMASRGLRAQLLCSDMSSFVRPGVFDFAFNLINTFRHVLDTAADLRHLDCIARSLRSGGVYVLGIDLVDYDDPDFGEEVWTARRGRCKVRHVMLNVPPDRRRRRERIINHLTVDRPTGREQFQSDYDLRSYSLGQWLHLLDRSRLECIAAFDFDWQPIQITGYTRDVNMVLRRRHGRRKTAQRVDEPRL